MGTPGDQIRMGRSWSGRKRLDGRTIGTIPPGARLFVLFESEKKDPASGNCGYQPSFTGKPT